MWCYWYFFWQSWFQLVIHSAHHSHDELCIIVKYAGWQYTALMYSFPNLKPVGYSKPSSNYCFLTCVHSQEAGKVVCYSHIFSEFSSLLWSTQSKALAYSMRQMSFWNSIAFSMIQQLLAIWSLVPLPFLNSACTYRISQFTYCWNLAWRVLSITC